MKDAKEITNNRTNCAEREGKFDGYAQVGVLYAGKASQENEEPLTGQPVVYWYWSTT